MLRQGLMGFVVLLAGAVAPAYGQEVTLKWKFKEGDKFYMEDTVNTKTNVTVLGMQVKEEQKTVTVTSYTVKSVSQDSVVLVQKIESVDAKSQGGLGGNTEKIMGNLKGATFTITMTPDGKITKFEGYKEFAKKLAGDDDELAKMMALFFSEDMFKAGAEQVFAFPPKNPVKKGDTWKTESTMPVPGLGDFKTVTDYTYNGKVTEGEEILMKQNLTYMAPKGGNLGGLFKIVKGNLKAENAKGKYIFDAQKGRLVSGTLAMTIRGSLTVDLQGMTLDLNMNIEQTSNSRVLDQNPVKE